MKHGGASNNFHAWLDEYESLLSELSTVYDEEVYWYIFTIDTRQATLDRIDKIKDPTQRQIAMNIAQRLEQRGIQKGMQQGIQQGIQEGMQKGIQKGIQEGMQQGIQQEKLHIARNMLAKLHLDIKTVAQATGLSERELIKVQQEAKT